LDPVRTKGHHFSLAWLLVIVDIRSLLLPFRQSKEGRRGRCLDGFVSTAAA
jgi:hypothetical protein